MCLANSLDTNNQINQKTETNNTYNKWINGFCLLIYRLYTIAFPDLVLFGDRTKKKTRSQMAFRHEIKACLALTKTLIFPQSRSSRKKFDQIVHGNTILQVPKPYS